MELKSYSTMNKVLMEGKSKHRFVKTLLKVIVVLMLLLSLTDVIFGDQSIFQALKRIALPLIIFIGGIQRLDTKGFRMAQTTVELHEFKVVIKYKIDREDKKGLRYETYEINYDDIQALQYSKSNECLLIGGTTLFTCTFENKKFKDIKEVLENHPNFICSGQYDDMVRDIQTYSKKIMEVVE